MITLFLVLVFGSIGGLIGEFGFEQHCIIGTVIGVIVALAIRFGGEGASGLADGMDFDFGGD